MIQQGGRKRSGSRTGCGETTPSGSGRVGFSRPRCKFCNQVLFKYSPWAFNKKSSWNETWVAFRQHGKFKWRCMSNDPRTLGEDGSWPWFVHRPEDGFTTLMKRVQSTMEEEKEYDNL